MRALTDGKTKIGAQLFPDRKRPAICVQKGNKIKIYGIFKVLKQHKSLCTNLLFW